MLEFIFLYMIKFNSLLYMNLDIIIPCYNEEKTIESTIIKSIKHLSTKDNLLIVDDGSTDESLK